MKAKELTGQDIDIDVADIDTDVNVDLDLNGLARTDGIVSSSTATNHLSNTRHNLRQTSHATLSLMTFVAFVKL